MTPEQAEAWSKRDAERDLRILNNENVGPGWRSCAGKGGRSTDCRHLNAPTGISWWCTSDEAVEYRNTAIPGIHGCPWWEPRSKVKKAVDKAEPVIINAVLVAGVVALVLLVIGLLL